MGYDARVEISPALGLDADYSDFLQMLGRYAEYDGVLVVGHNPNLFHFLGRLITGNGGAAIRMRKASVARVDMNRHPALLQWLIDPRSARAIYASVQKSSRPKTSRK
jgi:phosphohistidine phosphatase